MGSMGADTADLDNDLQPDLLVTEMLPKTVVVKNKQNMTLGINMPCIQRNGYRIKCHEMSPAQH